MVKVNAHTKTINGRVVKIKSYRRKDQKDVKTFEEVLNHILYLNSLDNFYMFWIYNNDNYSIFHETEVDGNSKEGYVFYINKEVYNKLVEFIDGEYDGIENYPNDNCIWIGGYCLDQISKKIKKYLKLNKVK